VIHWDNALTNKIIRPTCITACSNYEPEESDDVDSIEAEENSINECISILNGDVSGTREWFTNLGVMIAKLPNLTELTFDELDANAMELEGFWGKISASKSLTSLGYKDMNLKRWEGVVDPLASEVSIFYGASYQKT
jgi:hypothetical protein